MDLKAFVTETLAQIVEGVADAQERIAAGGTNATVNPRSIPSEATHKHGEATPVEFDVALVVSAEASEGSSSKVSGSVGILSVVSARLSSTLEGQSTGTNRNETVSRVKFTVQLAQPAALHEMRSFAQRSRGQVDKGSWV